MNEDVISSIQALYFTVLDYAEAGNLATDNIKLFVNPEVADRFGFEDYLFLGYGRDPLPIVRDSKIPKSEVNGEITSDCYITDLDWGKDVNMFEKIRSFLKKYWEFLFIGLLGMIVIWATLNVFDSRPITSHDMGGGVRCYTFNTNIDCLEVRE